MNKLVAIPMLVIVMLGLLAMVYDPTLEPERGIDTGASGSIIVDGTEQTVDIPGAGIESFNISGTQGALIILVAALIVGVAGGIKVLGSGLSIQTQRVIFLATVYYGMFALFTVLALPIILASLLFGPILWIILTVIFTVGFAQSATGGDVVDD